MNRSTFSERVLVLAPLGRDAALAVAMLGEAGMAGEQCASVTSILTELDIGAGIVVLTEEALATADLKPLAAWIAGQPEWSDLPFVVLTGQGGGIERNPAARRYLDVLGNATFVERPFHPTTLISLARAALRGRRRQYEARGRLEALRAGEERLQFALEAGGMGAWELDLRDLTLTASDNCRANFGFAPGSSFTYANLRDTIHRDDRDRQEAAVHAAVAGRLDYDIEYRVRWPATGEIRWVAIRGRPTYAPDGSPRRMAGVSSDVTDRKLAIQALLDSEERLRLATEHADIGFWDVDPIDDRLVWPPTVKAMFGISADAAVTIKDFYDGLHPDDRAATGSAYAAAADPTLRALYDVEYRTVGKEDGVERWVAAKGRGVFEGDRCVRLLGTAINVTARKAIEERIRDLNETLERRVVEEVAERTRAEDALRQAQKMEAVGQLTGGVAHDFNNLLTIIKSSTDLLRKPNLVEERRRRYVDAISDTVDRAAKLTGQLLAFARRQPLKPEVFEPSARVSAVTEMLRSIVGSRIEIVANIKTEDCFVEADVSQFETALVNMAVNARDAMDGEGSLTIVVETLPRMPAIRGHAGGAGAFVAVSLSDTGTGIPPEMLMQIFEPFYTTKEVGKGTGLGLSQVFGFAKQSGGDIDVQSEPGRGSRFTLYLPRVERDALDLDDQELSRPAPAGGGGQRVLVVEDNVEVGTFSTQLLGDLGYETTWAANGNEALKLLSDGDGFDAVFSDVVMPGMGGVELGLEIRKRYPRLPVVLTSGYSHVLAEEGRHGFELLQKPYAVEDLSRILRTAMRGKRGEARDGS